MTLSSLSDSSDYLTLAGDPSSLMPVSFPEWVAWCWSGVEVAGLTDCLIIFGEAGGEYSNWSVVKVVELTGCLTSSGEAEVEFSICNIKVPY